jgi:predicted Fe-Mo cluster-binding NifX family protein
MCLKKFKVAILTQEQGGLNDVVANVCGRAKSFTILDIEGSAIKHVSVFENPATYKHGAGPIVAKMLIDSGVHTVIAAEFGPGISTLLDQHSIDKIDAEAGSKVSELVEMLYPMFNEQPSKEMAKP